MVFLRVAKMERKMSYESESVIIENRKGLPMVVETR
jgi:hypothetical protein